MDNLVITACLKLRSKQDYYTVEEPSDNDSDSAPTPRVYWCLRTMQPIGPDDEPVNLQACQPGRGCYCSEE